MTIAELDFCATNMETFGYSNKLTFEKLGLKSGMRVLLISPPQNMGEILRGMPSDVLLLNTAESDLDCIMLFVNDVQIFENQLITLKDKIKSNGMIWIAWYKKAAKLPTELNENIVRDTALASGLVDVKVCAIDEIWSGLKLVIRKKDRG